MKNVWKLYHENSKLNTATVLAFEEGIRKYGCAYLGNDKYYMQNKSYVSNNRIKIKPAYNDNDNDLYKTIWNRKTERYFSDTIIKFETLEKIVSYSVGITNYDTENKISRRAYPSAGGLNSVGVYVIVDRVEKMEPGAYYYNPGLSELQFINKFEDIKPDTFNSRGYTSYGSACQIILTSFIHPTVLKYGNRGYRFMLYECGHVSQNISLISENENIGSLILGGVFENKVSSLLKINPEEELVQVAICLGNHK